MNENSGKTPEIERRDLDGWSYQMCPSCGTLVNEWLTWDGPDVVEYEECPMCAEASVDEDGGWW